MSFFFLNDAQSEESGEMHKERRLLLSGIKGEGGGDEFGGGGGISLGWSGRAHWGLQAQWGKCVPWAQLTSIRPPSKSAGWRQHGNKNDLLVIELGKSD